MTLLFFGSTQRGEEHRTLELWSLLGGELPCFFMSASLCCRCANLCLFLLGPGDNSSLNQFLWWLPNDDLLSHLSLSNFGKSRSCPSLSLICWDICIALYSWRFRWRLKKTAPVLTKLLLNSPVEGVPFLGMCVSVGFDLFFMWFYLSHVFASWSVSALLISFRIKHSCVPFRKEPQGFFLHFVCFVCECVEVWGDLERVICLFLPCPVSSRHLHTLSHLGGSWVLLKFPFEIIILHNQILHAANLNTNGSWWLQWMALCF